MNVTPNPATQSATPVSHGIKMAEWTRNSDRLVAVARKAATLTKNAQPWYSTKASELISASSSLDRSYRNMCLPQHYLAIELSEVMVLLTRLYECGVNACDRDSEYYRELVPELKALMQFFAAELLETTRNCALP